jgi:hypothetical protein
MMARVLATGAVVDEYTSLVDRYQSHPNTHFFISATNVKPPAF